jgi:hypothetical protein
MQKWAIYYGPPVNWNCGDLTKIEEINRSFMIKK